MTNFDAMNLSWRSFGRLFPKCYSATQPYEAAQKLASKQVS
jgi:hypothetical protein